jgi:hypothetical protein
MRRAFLSITALLLVAAVSAAAAQATAPRLHNRESAPLPDSPGGVALGEAAGDGLLWWPGISMDEGTIEIELRGRNVPQRSFIGVAFNGQDERTYETVYFRPFNFRAEGPGRTRAVQYISHPDHTWSALRESRPGVFESNVSPVPDPDGWFRVRIVISRTDVTAYVADAAEPSLRVSRIPERRGGWVGLWVGNGSNGAFRNLTITPAAGPSLSPLSR